MLETVACISKITNCCESVSKNNQNTTDQCPSGMGGKKCGSGTEQGHMSSKIGWGGVNKGDFIQSDNQHVCNFCEPRLQISAS